MKFLVINYSCLQNSVLSVFCSQLNLLNRPPPRTKFLGTPLTSSDDSALTELLRSTPQSKDVDWWKMKMDVNQMSKSSTDVGECDISNVVASDTRTILIIQIM